MNIILEGPDASGKTTLAEKLSAKFNMNIIHSTASTRNDFNYHIDLLDYQTNTVFDRFHVGETIFPIIYNREGKLSDEEFKLINRRIVENNDIFIIFYASDIQTLKDRLIDRGEFNYLDEIDQQNDLFYGALEKFEHQYGNYKNFIAFDVSTQSYDDLYDWCCERYSRTTVNVVYRNICRDLIEKGHTMETKNIRGNTKELCNYSFTITDIDNEIITLNTGKSDLTYLAGELLWYWLGRNDLEFIGKFSNMWKKLSDDGTHCNSAYGYILQEKHGFSQIEKIIELLSVDPYSRRAVLNLNVPNDAVIETKDEICTICLIYQIRDNKLHCTCVMRSNDVKYGLRNDLGYFLSLQKYIAYRLGINCGTYTHFAASMHMYDKDYNFVKNVAYGDLSTTDEYLNINKLLENRYNLELYIDNNWKSREDFYNKLIELGIIKYKL